MRGWDVRDGVAKTGPGRGSRGGISQLKSLLVREGVVFKARKKEKKRGKFFVANKKYEEAGIFN